MPEAARTEVHAGKPKRIVFIECAAAMGGVQFSTLYLAQHLDRAIWNPLVVCPEEGQLIDACSQSGIETQVLKQPALRSTSFRIGNDLRFPDPTAWLWDGVVLLRTLRRIIQFLKQTRPDLVVTKGLFPHLYGGLAARWLGIPCIWHVQDLISDRYLGLYRQIFSLAARTLPNHIIADGAAIGRQLIASKARVSVILNGVDVNVFRPGIDGAQIRAELGIPSGKTIIGHIGRMTPWKGQHYLLEAFARIAARVPDAYLVFVGDPVFDTDAYQTKLLNLTRKLGLTDRVRFMGYRNDLPQVLASMDVFGFTSVEKDTSPLTLLSALAAGLPIVAFDIEGVRELMDGDGPMLLVPTRDLDVLSEKLLMLISEPELRRRMSGSARRQAELRFGLDSHVASIEEIFLNVQQRSGFKNQLHTLTEYTLSNDGTVAEDSLRP